MSMFGELKLRTETPPPPLSSSSSSVGQQSPTAEATTHLNNSQETLNGFSTIDLNNTPHHNIARSQGAGYTSYDPIEGVDIGYTSFDSNNNNNATKSSNDANFSSQSMSPSTSSYSPVNSSTSSSMISSASEVSAKLANRTATTIESIRQWSKSAYKCTRQIVSERLGKSARTIDPEIENSIEHIRDLKRKYENILTLANSMTSHFRDVIHSQRLLAETFADLAQKSAELIDEFQMNCESQRQIVRHGEILLEQLHQFTSSIRTLCHKTIEDTFVTIRNFETARLEYDAFRCDLEYLKSSTVANGSGSADNQRISALEHEVGNYRDKYERLKTDVSIKMKFLDENRVNVMKKQLVLFQNATYAYFSGNQKALEQIVKQFKVPCQSNGSIDEQTKFQSFLEQN